MKGPWIDASSVDAKHLDKIWNELIQYCRSRDLSLICETQGCRRSDGRDVWTESVTVDGRLYARGSGLGRRKARAAACFALVSSGVLADFPDQGVSLFWQSSIVHSTLFS